MSERSSTTVELTGSRSLHAVGAGSGTDIVLIHGSLATHQDWLAGPFDRVAQLGRAIAIDRPGHGASRRAASDASPRHNAIQLAEGLRMLGLTRAVIVAHSFGARLALALAELYPEMVERLVLVAPAAFRHARPFEHAVLAPRSAPLFAPAWSMGGTSFADRVWLEAVHRMMFSPGEPTAEWRTSYQWETILSGAQMAREGEDFAELHPMAMEPDLSFSSIKTQTTILAGMADLIVDPGSQSKSLAEAMPNARFEPVAGEGHMLHHRRPDLLLEAIAEAVTA
jgi:pimeloyl-ACP methyl ester carboxylesterase